MTGPETLGVVFGGIGTIATIGGGLFWLGKLHGRVSEQDKEIEAMKKKIGTMETKQAEHSILLERVDGSLKSLKKGQEVMCGKFDEMHAAFLTNIGAIPKRST